MKLETISSCLSLKCSSSTPSSDVRDLVLSSDYETDCVESIKCSRTWKGNEKNQVLCAKALLVTAKQNYTCQQNEHDNNYETKNNNKISKQNDNEDTDELSSDESTVINVLQIPKESQKRKQVVENWQDFIDQQTQKYDDDDDKLNNDDDEFEDSFGGKKEFWSYQFWKCARTELVASLLFALITSYATILSRLATNDPTSLQVHLICGVVQAATATTLTQIFGQISGCHLTVGVTLALFVKGKITWRRLFAYTIAQAIGALFGIELLLLITSTELRSNVSGGVLVANSLDVNVANSRRLSLLPLALPTAQNLITPANCSLENEQVNLRRLAAAGCLAPNASQMFALQLIGSSLVVLTYLINADRRRADAGFKSLSIGLAYFVACVLVAQSDAFFASPAHFGALALLADAPLLSHWVSRRKSVEIKTRERDKHAQRC